MALNVKKWNICIIGTRPMLKNVSEDPKIEMESRW